MGLLGKVMRKRRLTRRMPESSRSLIVVVLLVELMVEVLVLVEVVVLVEMMIVVVNTKHVVFVWKS